MTQANESATRRQRAWGKLQLSMAALSVVCLAMLVIVYATRTPRTVLLTVFPFWVWASMGLVPWILSLSRTTWKRALTILAIWLIALAVFSEETRIPLHAGRDWPDLEWQEARASGDGIRVVSANCGGGIPEAAEEALGYGPDILMLQETPGSADLERIVDARPEYHIVHGFDVSILVRGPVESVGADVDGLVTRGGIAEVSGRRIGLVNTHLHLPYLKSRFWSPEGWRRARELYVHRAEQMSEVCDVIEAIKAAEPDIPIILAGDFNTPPGDPLFDLLPPDLRDSFAEAGAGLGNSITNDLPLSRIDFVWVDDSFETSAVVSRKTEHSDHRFVVADLTFGQSP